MIIRESNMIFGEYDKNDVFYIEKSEIYNKLKLESIKTTEFILLRENKILLIEAKTSTPNFEMYKESDEKRKKYINFINDITKKFSDSIDIYSSLLLNYIHSYDFPESFKTTSAEIVLVLVIKQAFPTSLKHYKEKLEKELKSKMKIWNIKSLLVISEEKAREKNLVT